MTIAQESAYGDSFRYLTRMDVMAACTAEDALAAVTAALLAHAKGEARLPAEAYLGWDSPAGHAARCLAMPGALTIDGELVVALKTINASLGNPDRGLARSQGFTILLDPETARPRAVLEAAYISAMRTAGVSMVAAQRLGRPNAATVGIIGCGALAEAHLSLIGTALPDVQEVLLFDRVPARAHQLAAREFGFRVHVARSAQECCQEADILIPATTTTTGYIAADWLRPGALVVHVSLDDLLPEVIDRADLVVVDDWALVIDDRRRLLGRMFHEGRLLGPDSPRPAAGGAGILPRVAGTLGQVLAGDLPGRADDKHILVCNPFGMSILDAALAHRVAAVAAERGLGQQLHL